MANTSTINLVGLDPDSIKTSLKAFLQEQSIFLDYDFEGSNIAVLLDLLAHNTFLNAFYLNMNMSESFLDSAQLKASVVSRAKELNYTPRSARSAKATVTLEFQTDADTDLLLMPKGTGFSTVVGSNTFTFYTNETMTLLPSSSNTTVNVYEVEEFDIYEGIYVEDSFVVDYGVDGQRFELSNKMIDTTSLVVVVTEDNGSTDLTYSQAQSLLGLSSSSKKFFLQQQDDLYEIIFGDDVIGRRPKNGAVISCQYRVSSGEEPNNASVFNCDADITDGHLVSDGDIVVTTENIARGGSLPETVESVRYYAPRHFQVQERAVVTDDYEILLKTQFPEINTVSVYGGDQVDPPQFGRVFVAVDIADVDGFPESKKTEYKNFLRQKMPGPIQPIMVDPTFVYLDVASTVRYNLNMTTLRPEDIKTIVVRAIEEYNESYLDDFAATLRYSRLVTHIDDAHESIVSNETDLRVYKKLVPTLGTATNYTVDFKMPLNTDSYHGIATTPAFRTSAFTYQGRKAHLDDNGAGTVSLYDETHNEILAGVGTIDYSTGKILLNNFTINGYEGDGIKFYVVPQDKDFTSSYADILTVEAEGIAITVEAVRE